MCEAVHPTKRRLWADDHCTALVRYSSCASNAGIEWSVIRLALLCSKLRSWSALRVCCCLLVCWWSVESSLEAPARRDSHRRDSNDCEEDAWQVELLTASRGDLLQNAKR